VNSHEQIRTRQGGSPLRHAEFFIPLYSVTFAHESGDWWSCPASDKIKIEECYEERNSPMTDIEGRSRRGLLTKQVAIVTGAGNGIGRGIAIEMAREGATVVIADIDKESSNVTEQQIIQEGGTALVMLTDISKKVQNHRLVEDTLAYFDKVDILVNNVGIGIHKGGGLLQLTRSAGESVLRTNMIEPLFLTQHIVREMIIQRIRGVVLFTSSIHSHVPYIDPVYAMTKAAIEMLVRNLAVELAEYGIRVNAVAPGAIATRNQTLSHQLVPLKRQRGTPADIAQAMVFLAAEETSGYITGQTLIVDGGFSLAHAEYWNQKGFLKE
jgi:3-oxoacyl-[acyl-carrier protein] reductase